MSCTSHLVYAGTSGCYVVITTQPSDVWYRHIPVAIYSLYNVAPDAGLTKSEKCRARYENKDWRLIAGICASSWSIYIHCSRMHGAYNVKLRIYFRRLFLRTVWLKNATRYGSYSTILQHCVVVVCYTSSNAIMFFESFLFNNAVNRYECTALMIDECMNTRHSWNDITW